MNFKKDYYPISKALEIIGCNHDDIIRLGSTGELKIYFLLTDTIYATTLDNTDYDDQVVIYNSFLRLLKQDIFPLVTGKTEWSECFYYNDILIIERANQFHLNIKMVEDYNGKVLFYSAIKPLAECKQLYIMTDDVDKLRAKESSPTIRDDGKTTLLLIISMLVAKLREKDSPNIKTQRGMASMLKDYAKNIYKAQRGLSETNIETQLAEAEKRHKEINK